MHGEENSAVHCGVIERSCMAGGCAITKWCMALIPGEVRLAGFGFATLGSSVVYHQVP